MAATVSFEEIRYIKLGPKGRWEKECIEKGIARIGFETHDPEVFRLCQERNWKGLRELWLSWGHTEATATRYTNETQIFFEDCGDRLWITFVGETLYWGTLEGPVHHNPDGDGTFKRVNGGWKGHDIIGEPLTKDRLSGALTKLATYRGTSCGVDVSEYVIRRINGQTLPEVQNAQDTVSELQNCCINLMKLLTWQDFEILVDLVFSSTGWRRLGPAGGTQKTVDLDLILPSTGERALLQVKSRTNQKELNEYIELLENSGSFDRMFFVYHSGYIETGDRRVFLVGPKRLSELIVDAGLVKWLINKTK